jgi:hypothetical protein
VELKSSSSKTPTGDVGVGDKVGEAVQGGRSVFVGSGVQEGRRVGLLVAGTRPEFVGVGVVEAVILGIGLDVWVGVFVGKGVSVGEADRKSPRPHAMIESSKKIPINKPQTF